MVQIHRIGHDHQPPFWVVFVRLVVQGQAVTQGENKAKKQNFDQKQKPFAAATS